MKQVFDIEVSEPVVLKDWELKMFDRLSNGFKAGEMAIISTPRQTGKSIFNDWYRQYLRNNNMKYSIEAQAQVDGEEWYTIRVVEGQKDISAWLRSLDNSLAVEHKQPIMAWCDSMFDVHEKIYIMMELKFK